MTTISTLPTPPLRSDPATFAARGDAFLGALPVFCSQTNSVVTELNGAASAASAASVSAALSSTAASAAASMVNFVGDWSSLTGAYTVPTIVRHSNLYWSLTTNTSTIQSITPGVSALWVVAPFLAVPGRGTTECPRVSDLGSAAYCDLGQLTSNVIPVLKSSTYSVTKDDLGKTLVVSGTTTITLPLASSVLNTIQPFSITIKAVTGATVTVARSGTNTIETVGGNKSMTANTALTFFPTSSTAWETI